MESQTQNRRFTVSLNGAGFTDQLLQFSAFYRLCRSVNYEYLHTEFSTKRSRHLKEKPYGRIAKTFSKVHKKWSRIRKQPHQVKFNIHDHLGVNQLLRNASATSPFEPETHVLVKLGDDILEANQIGTFSELQAYLVNLSSELLEENVLQLRLKGDRLKLFSLINQGCPKLPELLNLSECSSVKLEDSLFRPETSEFRILLHIRQGDTSIIKTPWNTYIPIRRLGHGDTREFENIEDINRANIFGVEEYQEFLESLLKRLKDKNHSTVCFSDGFKRGIDRILSKEEELNLTRSKKNALLRQRKTYDKKAFASFSELKECRMEVGESEAQLRQFIATIMDANIIITSVQQRMLPKLVTLYTSTNDPLVIVLYRKNQFREYSDLVQEPHKRFLFIEIESPDFEAIMAKIEGNPLSLHQVNARPSDAST